jgi:hypothetical protein
MLEIPCSELADPPRGCQYNGPQSLAKIYVAIASGLEEIGVSVGEVV